MKKLFLILSLALTTSVTAQLNNDQVLTPLKGIYFGAGYGWVNSVNADNKFSGDPREEDYFSVFGGGTFFKVFRAEAELLHMRTDDVRSLSPAQTRLSGISFNGYAGLPIKYIRPYIGLGFGWGWMEQSYPGQSIEQSGTHTSAIYQAMLGVDIDIPQSPIKISAEWKSILAKQNEADDDWDDTEDELSLHANIFQVKIRYQF